MEILRKLPPLVETFKDEMAASTKRFKTSPTFDNMIGTKAATSLSRLKKFMIAELPKISKTDLNEMFAILHEVVPAITIGSDSLEIFYSFVRKLLKTQYATDPELESIMKNSMTKMFYKEKAQKIRDIASKVAAKNQLGVDRMTLTSIDVDKIMKSIKNSDDPYDQLIFVELAVGSRLIEIAKVSEYQEIPDKPHMIRVIGMAKVKTVGEPPLVIEKPIINATSKEILRMVKNIRSKIKPQKTNIALTNAITKSVNKRVKELFKTVLPDYKGITSYDLRKIYGSLSYELFADKTKYSLNGWLSHVLGHQKDNLSTANYYSTVNIKPSEPEVKEPEPEPVKIDPLLKIQANLDFINKKLGIIYKDGKFVDGVEYLLSKL